MVFLVQTKKSENQRQFEHIQVSLDFKFHFKLRILIFWTKFAEMSISVLKQKNEHRQHNQTSLATKFDPTQNLEPFQHCLNYQKLEHYHVARHVQTNLGVKFNLK